MKIKFQINTSIGRTNLITHFVRHRYEIGNWKNLIYWVKSDEKSIIKTTYINYANYGDKILDTRDKLENKKFLSRMKY